MITQVSSDPKRTHSPPYFHHTPQYPYIRLFFDETHPKQLEHQTLTKQQYYFQINYPMSKRHQSQPNGDIFQNNGDIVNYLMTNVYKQNRIDFYTNLETSALEELITSIFIDSAIKHQQKIFVVSLLKRNTFILTTAFTHQKFDFQRVFEFILTQNLTFEKLSALEQIFLPFCKKFPEKVLKLLEADETIKAGLLEHIYLKSIFKILYTSVFCIQADQIITYRSISKQILTAMKHSVLYYSPNQQFRKKRHILLFLDEVPGNYKDFLADLATNIGTVQLQLLLDQVQLINEEFITQLMQIFLITKNQENMNQYSQNIILIYLFLMKLYETVKFTLSKEYSQQSPKHLFKAIETKLHMIAKNIANFMPSFISVLLQTSKSTLSCSSGQSIPTVGMIRYRILQLVEKILSINELQGLSIDFEQFDFFLVAQLYLERFKWNNLIHNLILQISDLVLCQDYKHFKERHILNLDSFENGLFGNLIVSFRNKKYIFLHSLHMINNGNQNSLFDLSRLLVNYMTDNNDIMYLLQNFKIWKEFMEKDLKDYQTKNVSNSKIPFTADDKLSKTRVRQNSFDLSSSFQLLAHHNRPLQTFQRVMLKLKEEEKWSPKLLQKSTDKKVLMVSNAIKRLDSLSTMALQKQM